MMTSNDRIRHAVLVDLLRRARNHLPSGPHSQKSFDEADSILKDQMLLAVDIDTVFEALWQRDLLPGNDRPEHKHPIEPSGYKEIL
jgi:hypothetical protein